MRVWMMFLWMGWVAGPAAGGQVIATYPVLGEREKAQVDTAVDGERPDEPALYPLLLNMRLWTAQDVAGLLALWDGRRFGSYAGWGHVLEDPEGARGQPVQVQARFAGRVREVKLLRGGPWGPTVTEWGLVADGPKDAPGRAAVVLFPGEVQRPRDRQRVRVAARFFKLWTDVDAAGVATTYPVFVAAPFWEPVGGADAGAVPWRAMAVVVAVLVGVLWQVRRWLRRGQARGRGRGVVGLGGDRAVEIEDERWVELPEDPAQALGVLRERGQGAAGDLPERA